MGWAYLLDLGLRGASIALLALLALVVLQRRPVDIAAALTTAFALTLVAYLLCSAPIWDAFPRWLQLSLMIGCLANPLLFWLFTRAIFEDQFRLGWRHALLLLAVEVLGFLSLYTTGTAQLTVRIALQALNLGLVVAALLAAYRGRATDLIEVRRKLRMWLITVAGGYMALVLLVEAFLRGATPHPLTTLLNAAAICVVVFCVAVMLARPNLGVLFERAHNAAPDSDFDAAARELRARLDAAIATQTLLQEGLSIGKLAEQLNVKEYALRALINSKLGFRNFNDFLNQHRIALACQQLADPQRARTPVLTLALNLGYGSIGPFNRAFKQAMGLTPTQYRRQKLGELVANELGQTGTL